LSVSPDARSRADGGVAEGQLQVLLVDERYRRRGIGMALMSIAEQELRLRSMHIGSVLLAHMFKQMAKLVMRRASSAGWPWRRMHAVALSA